MRSRVARSTCAALLLCAVPLFPAAAGVVIHVPVDQTTIAAGLAAATAGDTVVVACDTYHETGLNLPSDVVLMSAEYYAWKGTLRDTGCVVIDGDDGGLIMTCESITGAEVHDITFTGGSDVMGGAVYCHDSDVLFDFCFFTENTAQAGAGIYWSGGTPTIYACEFNRNTATDAGAGLAIYLTDGHVGGCRFGSNQAQWGAGVFANQLGTTTGFTECEFQWNEATEPSMGGGGVYCGTQAGPTFEQCWFNQNEGYYGGAVHNSVKAEPSFIQCQFESNWAVWYGGAVYGYDDDASFDSCEFDWNLSTEGSGGAMALDKSDITMDFCTLFNNEAVAGGGIFATQGATMDITSCTIVENIVQQRAVGGAGVFVNSDARATINKTIIAFNRNGEGLKCDNGGTATLTCSDVSDNAGGDWIGCIAGQESSSGNLHVNPLFCAAAARDFHLCADSACLPSHNDCGELIGAWDEGCTGCGSPVERTSWGSIKAMYR